jgi:hypothetical protein
VTARFSSDKDLEMLGSSFPFAIKLVPGDSVMMDSLPGAVANWEGSKSDFDFRDKALRRAFIAAEV